MTKGTVQTHVSALCDEVTADGGRDCDCSAECDSQVFRRLRIHMHDKLGRIQAEAWGDVIQDASD